MKPAYSRYFPAWETADLPLPPRIGWRHWTALIGPGLLMVGNAIGGGEWMFGPILTAQYGGQLMWLATVSIALQVFYNLEVMRYTLYTGEPIFVGLFRTAPGPKFWTPFYLLLDSGAIWPYLASNAAVPLASLILGHLPIPANDEFVRRLGYAIFLGSFVPLIFGGKVYNTLERIMVTKVVLVLGYLSFLAVFLVNAETWGEIFSGFIRFGAFPEQEIDWATMAAFAAIAGAGGLSNTYASNYVRDKGWGMGLLVGAIPSAIGGKRVALSHVGKIFPLHAANLQRWRGWVRHIVRDQALIWAVGCLLGVALPALVSLQFIAGAKVEPYAAAAMTSRAIANQAGEIFWTLTLICGFIILAPGQIANLDGITRRWTDIVWIGSKHLRRLPGQQVKLVYYTIMGVYGLWGLLALRLTPNPLVLAIATAVLLNFGLGFSALHTLYLNRTFLPPDLRPSWVMQLGLVACSVFFTGISMIALAQRWPQVWAWLSGCS